MRLLFSKLQATGNDFIVVDNRDGRIPIHAPAAYERLCHRRFGIGADGVIFLQLLSASHAAQYPDYHYEMVYLNADGRVGSMCGNGGRCSVLFAHRLGLLPLAPSGPGYAARFLAYDGPHQATLMGHAGPDSSLTAHADVSLQMGPASPLEKLPDGGYFINTGSPHYLRFLGAGLPAEEALALLEALDVQADGAAVRYNARFAPEGGVNVNYIVATAPDQLHIRTYERGVEAETFSCGTGVTAAALAHAQLHGATSPITVHAKGGGLSVRWQGPQPGSTPWLVGPAVHVFDGTTTLELS